MSSSPDHDATVRALTAGMRLFDRYRLESIAGRGGMGVVWRARDDELERTVALKFLPEFVASDPEAARDLKRETKRSLELTHVNIVRVFDFLTDGRDAAIAMEFVEGDSLAARKARAPGGCLSVEELAPLARQLCTALSYAHTEAKIVHRDLKPANLLVTPEGKLKITDFGIARSLSESQTRLTGRAVAGTSGTLLYISPQQMGGDKPSPADDVYALGATLYELLTGKPPFYRGDAFSLMKQVAERAPTALEEHRADAGCEGPPIPEQWSATILACLSKDPAHRPVSAEDVGRRLFGPVEAAPKPAPVTPPVAPPPAPAPAAQTPTPNPAPAPAAKVVPPPLPPPFPQRPVAKPPSPAKPPPPAEPKPVTPPVRPATPPPKPPVAEKEKPVAPPQTPAEPESGSRRAASVRYDATPQQPESGGRKRSKLPFLIIPVLVLGIIGGFLWYSHVKEERAREEAAQLAQEFDYKAVLQKLEEMADSSLERLPAATLTQRITDMQEKVDAYLVNAPARYRSEVQSVWLARKLSLQEIVQRNEREAVVAQAKRDREDQLHRDMLRRIASVDDDASLSLVNTVDREVTAYASTAVSTNASAARAAWTLRKNAWNLAEQKRKDTRDDEEKRRKRAQDDAVSRARLGALLDSAKAADRPETAEQALQLLNQILEIDPKNAEALALKKKVEGYARTLRVPGRYSTLADALKVARAGDTIELAGGVHVENPPGITIPVTIRGAGMDATILRQPAVPSGTTPSVALWITGREGKVKISDLTIEASSKAVNDQRASLAIIDGTSVEMSRVRLRKGTSVGVWIKGGANVRASNCRFDSNDWSGACVEAKGTTVVFEGCAFESNGAHGFMVLDGATAEVTNCVARLNTRVGLTVQSGSRATLTKCSASDNKEGGFWVDGENSHATCIDNEGRAAPDPFANFMVSNKAGATFRNNRALDSANVGFMVWKGATADFNGDEGRNNVLQGFKVAEGSTARFTSTIARDNRSTGYIFVGAGSRGTLTKAVSNDNGGNGIYVREGATAAVSEATILRNKMTGIYCEDDSRVTFQGVSSRVESNGNGGTDNYRLPVEVR